MTGRGESKEELLARIKRLEGEVSTLQVHLRDSERQARLRQRIIDDVDDVVYIIAEEGQIEYLSRAFERVTGWRAEQWLGKNFLGLIHPDDESLAIERHRLILRSPGPATHRLRVRQSSGDYLTGEFRYSLIQNADGTASVLGVARDVSDHSVREEHERIEREMLRAMVGRSPLGISVRDRKGRLLSANESWRRIWKIPDAAFQEDMTRDRECLKFDDRDQYLGDWMPEVERIYRQGGSLLIPELRIDQHRSGQIRWLSQLFYAIMDSHGQVDRVVIVTEDITDRKTAQDALAESENKYRSLVESAQDAIFTFDKNGVLLFLNQVAAASLGGSPRDLIGKTQWDLFPKPIADRQMASIRWVCETGREKAVESVSEVGGRGRRYYTKLQPVPGPDGKVVSVLGVSRDITELIETREALREKEREHSRLLQDLPVGVFRSTVEGVVEAVNPALARMYGFDSEAEILSRPAHDGFCDPRQRLKIIERLRRDGWIRDYECKMRRKDGSFMWISMSVKAVLDENGQMTHLDGVEVDITERKRAQEALRQSGKNIRALLDATTNVLYLMDTEGIILALNQATSAVKGASEEELVGTSAHARLPEAVAQNRRLKQQEVVTTGRPVRFFDEDAGRIREHSYFPVFDDEGAVSFIAVYSEDVTVRKRSEDALRESEEKYRNLFENAQAGMFRSALDGSGILAVNRRMADIWGYSVDEILALPVSTFWTSSGVREEFVRRLQAEGVVRDFEVSTVRKDGSPQHALLSAKLFREKGYIEGTVVDITDRKVAEQALNESEQAFRALAETAPVGIGIFQGDGLVFANQRIYQLLDIDPNDREKADLFAFAHPDFREMVRERTMARQRGEDVPESYEVRIVRKSGETRWLLLKGRRIDFRGQSASLGIAVDITDQKKAVEAIRESEEKYRGLLERLTVGVFQSTPEGKILTANPILAQMYGFDTVDELLSTPALVTYAHPEDRERMLDMLRRDGRFDNVEFEMKRPDGSTFWVSVSTQAICDAEGRLVGFEGVESDITERKLFEEALKESNRRYAELFSATPTPTVVIDSTGVIVDINDAHVQQIGGSKVNREDYIGINVLNHPSVVESGADELYKKALKGELSEAKDVFFPRVTRGNEGYFNVRVSPVFDGNGKVAYIIATHEETTDRKKYEDALRESQAQLSAIVENTNDIILLSDDHGSPVYFNSAYRQVMKDLINLDMKPGLKPHTLLPDAEERAVWEENHRRVLGGEHFGFEHSMVGPDGQRRYFETSYYPVKEGEKITGFSEFTHEITERRKADEALRASEEMLRSTIASMDDLVFLLDMDGTFTAFYYSGPESDLYIPAAEFVGKPYWDVVPPGVAMRMTSAVEALKATGEVQQFDYYLDFNSHRTWYSAAVSMRSGADGKPVGTTLVARDITKRKKAEDELRVSEEKFRQLLVRLPVGVIQVSAEGRILSGNPALAEMYGFESEEELAGLEANDYFRNPARAEDLARALAQSGRVTDFEAEMRRRDGSFFWVSLSVMAVYDQDGRLNHFDGVEVDITDRLAAMEAVRDSEEKFRRIAERSSDIIIISDLDGNLTFISPAVEQVLGYSPAQLLGRNVTEVIHESSLPDLAWGFAEIKQGRAVEALQVAVIGKRGKPVNVEASATPIVRGGLVVGSQAIVRDVSERKRAEEMLERAHEEQSRQLRQVAGGLAHDIYNDLFPVSASLYKLRQRLEQTQDRDRTRNLKLVALMDTAVRRAIDLTESVNLYSKLEAVGLKDSACLAETLDEVIIQNRERIASLGVETDIKVSRSIRIRCPQPHVFYLFNNLLLNALDAVAKASTRKISVTAVRAGNRVRIEFGDTGCGIDPAVLPRVFEPFFSTKPKTGTGLGLATVKRVLDLCNGSIEIKSSLDKGATFIILLSGDVGT